MAKVKKEEEEYVDVAKDFSKKFFKANKDFHLNYETAAEDYFVSSGSILVDSRIGGGFQSGLLRFCGCNEGGKTSEALEIIRNALETVPQGRGLYIKAEGRLSPKIQERSGVNFVFDPDQWEDGTCLVFECNVFDVVFDYLRGLFKHNPEKKKYFIVIDSMDGLLLKSDLDKTTGEAAKVAGGALLTSDFLKRVSLGMSKFGHLCIMLSQVRAKVAIDQYAPKDTNNQTGSSGGNASLHYPDWIFEFMRQFKDDKILENPDAKESESNKKIGHYAKVMICKSTNETTGQVVRYPIKYGRKGGKSIWIEREIVEMLVSWGFIEKSASWLSFDDEFRKACEEAGINIPIKIQGMKNLYDLFEKDPALTSVGKKFVKENILNK